MIMIITSQGNTFESEPSRRFGRSPVFIRYDLESDKWEALNNPAISEPGGAGVAASQYVIDQQASIVISGRFGPNAFRVLEAAEIQMFTFGINCSTVRDVIEAYKHDSLKRVVNPG